MDFTEPVVLVLTSLAEGPKHGYALAKDIESFAGIKLGPGTLYGALSRLEDRGWIEALPASDRWPTHGAWARVQVRWCWIEGQGRPRSPRPWI